MFKSFTSSQTFSTTALSNGPEMASCLLTVMSRAACVPVNSNNSVPEIVADLRQVRAQALIIENVSSSPHLVEVAETLDLTVQKFPPPTIFEESVD